MPEDADAPRPRRRGLRRDSNCGQPAKREAERPATLYCMRW
jgi:hypothetical protein